MVGIVAITVMLFGAGMVLASGLRFSCATFYEGAPLTRMGRSLARPAHLDVVAGLVFVSCFGPLAY
ncbi:hypothetical protein [Actinoplanes sp. NPDC026619]|uniref:hypothetical protein n=1 Tax=Actinoplanes sp. NPDC026619 TaxID=3155798 RepID=UPI0033D73D81